MNTNEFLDDIRDECEVANIQMLHDRFTVLGWASAELNRLSHEFHSDCFLIHLDPIVNMVVGTRYYDLPRDFGSNFAPGAGDGDKFCCKLDDGTNESLIDYISPAQFYSKNLRAEANGKPTKYTIVSSVNGVRQVGLSPPPDDTYTLDGLYKPTNWKLETMDALPPIPGNSAILKYAVLRRISPERWNEDYILAKQNLALEFAQSKIVRMVPRFK